MASPKISKHLEPTTPAFVIDVPVLDEFVERFRSALDAQWPGSILSYSFKTNALPWLISHMRERGVWAEVVSDTEYELALALGYAPDRIVYNGPIKSRARLRAALQEGSVVNLDAKREVTWTAELARERPDLSLGVGLRVNWDLEALCPGESTTAEEGSRFGFDADNGELDRAISELTSAGVRISGLHMHRNSLTQSLGVYRASASVAAGIIRSRALDLEFVDIGGGFFGNAEGSPTFADYVAAIREELDPVLDARRTRLIVEPGGSLIAVPVEFHAGVLDVKDVGSRRVVVTDASRTDIDPLFRRRRAFSVLVDAAGTAPHPRQIISGFTCMEDDRLMRLEEAPELAVGDRIVFRRVGAYTMSYQSTFIELPPAVYVREGDSLTEVRRAGRIADYLQGNRWIGDDDLRAPADRVRTEAPTEVPVMIAAAR
jgi:diaminopimelate decarboxylase